MSQRSSLRHRFEYVALRLVEAAAALLPRGLSLRLGEGLGWLAWKLGVRRGVVVANLTHVGLGSQADLNRLLPQIYRTMGKYVMDFLRGPHRMPPYRIENRALLQEKPTRGALFVLAHFGNFEMLASVFGSLLDNVNVIVKPMHNPYVENWLLAKRKSTGVNTMYQQAATRQVFGILRDNGMIGLLIDQHPGKDGTPAPFLGKTANTVRAVAALQEKTGCDVVSAYAILGDDDSYDVHITHEKFEDAPAGDRNQRIDYFQARHNAIIGAWVEAHPEHWFGWFHRRFREYVDYP